MQIFDEAFFDKSIGTGNLRTAVLRAMVFEALLFGSIDSEKLANSIHKIIEADIKMLVNAEKRVCKLL